MPPAKTNTTPATDAPRVAVTERGAALLALVAAAGGTMFLTQAEAIEAVNAGFLTVDANKVEGDTAEVTLTDAGRATLTAAPNSSGFALDTDVPMPEKVKTRAARSGGYPFGVMEVGQSFHVPKAADAKDATDLINKLNSSVSGARAKFAVQDGDKVETKKVRTYAKDAAGKFVKDAAGKRVLASETTEERPVMLTVRDFAVHEVDASDPRGAGVRVFRTK